MKPQKSQFEISGPTERFLKNIALVLGLASAVAVVIDAYPYTMSLYHVFVFSILSDLDLLRLVAYRAPA